MNILFFSSEFPSPTDPLRAVFNGEMIRGLAKRHRIHVVCPVAWTSGLRGARPVAQPQAAGADTAIYPRFYFPPRVALHQRGTWMWWSLHRQLARVVRENRPDVVLAYWAHPDGEVALRLARSIGVPVVLMVGGSDVLVLTKEPLRRARIESVLRNVDEVITIGGKLRERVIEMGVPASRVTSVMRPVDTEFFHPGDRTAARSRLGLPADAPVLLWVGRLVPVKDVGTLLRAIVPLRETYPDVVLCLAGRGPLAAKLMGLCDRLGIGSSVRWLGAVRHDDLPDWYRAADVTVLPSLSEGVPNVLLESVACGTPFVASSVGSIPEIADEACDRLAQSGEAPEFATAIADVLAMRDARPVRVRGVVPEPVFQAQLDEVLSRCVSGVAAPHVEEWGLRSATLIKPNPVRQFVRRALLESVPRSYLLASGKPNSRAVCLTFDDGPHDTVTTGVLDVLKRAGAPATFFVRGDRASMRPDVLRRIVDEGHLLGHHSWSHTDPATTSAPQLLAEVRRTREWLHREVGVDSPWFRPPHGKVTISKVMRLWTAGQTVALWNVDPGDVFRSDAKELLDWFAVNPPRPGDVVLLHDTSTVTLDALPSLISMIRTAGLELTTLDRFVGRPSRA